MVLIFLFIAGLVFGSFLAALTWRMMHGVSIANGRSVCDFCKKPIEWIDNIPLISYLMLKGKCRHCHKKISPRYPIIEGSTALTFVAVYALYGPIATNFQWASSLLIFGILFFLFVAFISIAIFVTDIEEMVIPDVFVFVLFFVSFLTILFSSDGLMWERLLVSFLSSSFFLILNLLTKGRGMGLGDVKLALPFGLILGFPLSVVWIFLSFIVGSLVGIFLLLTGKATKRTKIPFGPFMIISFWMCVLWGPILVQYLTPFFSYVY